MEGLLWLLAVAAVVIGVEVLRRWRRQRRRLPNLSQTKLPGSRAQKQLIKYLNGDRQAALRLVSYLKKSNPGEPEEWYWEKALYDLERDRGRL